MAMILFFLRCQKKKGRAWWMSFEACMRNLSFWRMILAFQSIGIRLLRQKKGWMEFKIISRKQQARFVTKKIPQNEFKPFFWLNLLWICKKNWVFSIFEKKKVFLVLKKIQNFCFVGKNFIYSYRFLMLIPQNTRYNSSVRKKKFVFRILSTFQQFRSVLELIVRSLNIFCF